jgi:ketosteroid isomerase-like protein
VSQENVELVRTAYAAFNRRDVDAAMKEAAPDAELDLSRASGPYRGVYRLDQLRRAIDDFVATFESVRFEPDEFIDAGEYVVVPVTVHIRGRDGIEATARGVQLWTIRDGTVVRFCLYHGKEAALEAVGLSEQDAQGAN